MTPSLSKRGNSLLVLAASALLTTSGAAEARAQTSEGAIHGTAVSAQGGAPILFALVRLERADADTTALARLVADDAGKFRFGGLAAGDYRLRLELEWLDGDKPMGKGSINYSDVSVEGSRLRLPTTGHLEAGTSSHGADADLTFAYWGFQEMQAQPVRSGAH